MQSKSLIVSVILVSSVVSIRQVAHAQMLPGSSWTDKNFPPYIKRLTHFGERPDWSPDGTEVMGLDLATGKIRNYSNSPNTYDEPEGIFPDGRSTLVESNRQHPELRGSGIDLYRLFLDGSNRWERLTWFNEAAEWKATNPVVSNDGRYFAFQVAKVKEMAGVGHGLYIYDLQEPAKNLK